MLEYKYLFLKDHAKVFITAEQAPVLVLSVNPSIDSTFKDNVDRDVNKFGEGCLGNSLC